MRVEAGGTVYTLHVITVEIVVIIIHFKRNKNYHKLSNKMKYVSKKIVMTNNI